MPRPVVPIFLAPEEAFGDLVDGNVVRHDQVRIGREQQAAGVHAPLVESGEFGEQHSRVHHDTVADDVRDARSEDSGRDQMQCELVAVRKNHSVSGVVTALVAHHPLQASAQ